MTTEQDCVPVDRRCTRCRMSAEEGAEFYVYRGHPEAQCKECLRAVARARRAGTLPDPEPAPPKVIDPDELSRRRARATERAVRFLERTGNAVPHD